MKIRHAEDPSSGRQIENAFVAYDDLHERLGSAVVTDFMAGMLYPGRPHQLLVRLQCKSAALDALLGAATARAMYLAQQRPGTPARIFCACAPDDEDRMCALRTQGYTDDDGLVRMRKSVAGGSPAKPAPEGCILVWDKLEEKNEEEEIESAYFIARYNAMFAADKDKHWLRDLRNRPNFARLLMVAPGGLAGELLTWSDGSAGVIGMVQTAPRWRKKGVAGHLVGQAFRYWRGAGLSEAYFDVRLQLAGAARLTESAGFYPAETLLRYPGINIF